MGGKPKTVRQCVAKDPWLLSASGREQKSSHDLCSLDVLLQRWRHLHAFRRIALFNRHGFCNSPAHCHIENTGIVMPFTPTVAIHTTFALSAVALGPFALWTRLGQTVRPRWHRAAGYAWVTCLTGAALSAAFIRSERMPLWQGYGPIHLLIVVTFFYLWRGFACLAQGNTEGHRKTMQRLYIAACVVTGLFTLLPQRTLGQLVWGQWLGWV